MGRKFVGIWVLVLFSVLAVHFILDTRIRRPADGEQADRKRQSAYEFFRIHPKKESGSLVLESLGKFRKKVGGPREKPHLVDVDGLDELYSSLNVSEDEKKCFAVWPRLRSVLSRSDALPETAKGVKEASIAWRELISIAKEEQVSKISLNGDANVTDSVKCPSVVSTFTSKAVYNGGRLLELPCGLTEDSSISLIGIPNGRNKSFQIILEGASFKHEQKPPIILHYNVYLPEENSTIEPVIIQNTWTIDFGWGKEEKCPKRRSLNATKVDRLATCNTQFVRNIMEENQNTSSGSPKHTDNLMGHAHASTIFPFSEGSPFTATIWVGSEGFHMSVNGRHETSFKFGENLDPWLVNAVRVTGGVTILSGLAKSLPVSEDLDLNDDMDQLRAPQLLQRRVTLLVGVFSTANNFERRMALRRTWMQYEAVRSSNVSVRFIIGFHKNPEVNLDLWREAREYGDIQLMPFVDYYSLISLKTIAICILGTKIIPAKYIMKTDDDAFVRIDEVLASLKEKPTDSLLYGLISFQSSPHRDKNTKWFISYEEWPTDSFPPWAHGPGYIVSRDIAKFIVLGHQERDLQLFKLEDVAMGIWIDKFKKSGHDVKYITDDRFNNVGCDIDYILAHYQNPRKVLCLWEKLQKEHQPLCCE